MRALIIALAAWVTMPVVNGQTVAVTMPNITNQNVGAQFNVAVQTATNILASSNVKAYQFSIALPPNCTFVSIVHNSGDLGFSWGTPTHNVSGGVLTIASAGTTNITGSGTFFRVRLQAASPGTQTITFSPTNQCFFNQGSPGRTLTNGSVQVNPLPTITVSPENGVLVIGEAVPCSAGGGTAPYTFGLTNPTVGTITGSTFTPSTQGTTRVQATDAGGFIGESGVFDVRSFEAFVGSDQGNALHSFSVPVTLNNPGARAFSAGELQVGFDNGVFNFTGVTTSATLLTGTTLISNVIGNTLYISFGTQNSITPANGSVLCHLNFVKDPTWSGGANASISIQSLLFNEVLNARTNGGFLILDPPQTMTLDPGPSLLKSGQTLQFTANGGSPPYTWTVANGNLGAVSSTGLFTALNNGSTTVTVQDAAGNSVTSGSIPVYDADLSIASVSVLQGTVVHVPIVLGPSVNNEPVLSCQFTLDYPATWMSFIGVEQTGTLSQGWSTTWSTPTGQLIFSAAGTQPVSPGGVLIFLKFQLLAPFTEGTQQGLSFQSAMINEGDPSVLTANGTVFATGNTCGAAGCMNAYACNYNATALCDDGTCAFIPSQCGVKVSPRVILEGPYVSSTGLMSDAMRSLAGFPLTEPFTALGYAHVGGGGGETTTGSVLATTGNNAIVDWVVVELRNAANPATRVASRSALVQRDGDVVATDGSSALTFNVPVGSYYVAVRHRNHLGAMTLNPVTLSSAPATVDFTSAATATFGTSARKSITGTFPAQALWAGDVLFNGNVQYAGAGNDRDPILITVGSTTPNNVVNNVYSTRDVNMNGSVSYVGSGNDRDPILVNVGGSTPNNIRVAQLP